MRVLDILLEEEIPKARLRLEGGKWRFFLPDGSVVGAFNSQREAAEAAAKNPSMLFPKPKPKT